MNAPTLLASLAIALPVSAQEHPSTIRPIGAMQAISHSCGLQDDSEGHGLFGVGTAYRARFGVDGVRYEPALGEAAPELQHLRLSRPTVTRGDTTLAIRAAVAPEREDLVARYPRAEGVEERFEVQPDGVELSWWFATRPAGGGDLVVRYAVDTSLGEPVAKDGGLSFAREFGGVRLGKVTGVDAAGARVEGEVQWDGSGVRLSLPASFVDAASYPLTLDPLLGTAIIIGSISTNEPRADAAYDAGTDHWLVVWLQAFAGGVFNPVAQLVTNSGFLVGPQLVLDTVGSFYSTVRVADLGVRSRFGIVFIRTVGALSTVEFRTVDAITGAIGSGATLFQGGVSFADIGAECEAPIGSPRGFIVSYHPGIPGNVLAQRLFFTAADSLSIASPFAVWAASPGIAFSQPAISRAAAADGKLLIVAKQLTGSPGSASIVAAVLDSGSDTVGATATVASSSGNDLSGPDVDGYAGQWVVAYEAPGTSVLAGPGVRVRPVSLDGTGNTLLVGPVGMSFGGFSTNQASGPSVAYSRGRTWLGYRSIGSLIGGGAQLALKVSALDSGSCAFCNESFTLATISTATTTVGHVAVATMTSGGAADGEDALSIRFLAASPSSTSASLQAQRLRDYGTAGTTTNLGGGCGSAGAVAFNHEPGIGSGGFRCSLNGVPPTTLATIFNFSPPSATLPCGGCAWTPFSVTLTPPIVGGTASVEFPIPCVPTLVGAQFETQWTSLDLTQAPCPVFPGFVLSDRSLSTIGN